MARMAMEERSRMLQSAAERIDWQVLLCVAPSSIIGGLTFGVTAINVNGYGDSTLMAASFGGAAAGLTVALPVWFWRRATLKGVPSLRNLHARDVLQVVMAAIVMCPFAAIAGFLLLPICAIVVPDIEVLGSEAVADAIFFSIPATLFYVVVLSGMQAVLEWRLLARAIE